MKRTDQISGSTTESAIATGPMKRTEQISGSTSESTTP